ncbi:hypothetical protein HK097_010923 [Rhizophlyctis rosea]|uniref:Uncharacterized protein n=1 Tax=Rhizophlyctis rosea TaxID=64517 RepID=A0AAD5WZH6_9FUNG|nr:hypothetical protein HK097_010923 [Rhizophlyctis rosea]
MSKELHNTIQEDWDNRDVIEGIVLGMQQMTGFLTRFDLHARQSLANLDGKLSQLERKLSLLEAKTASATGQQLGQSSVNASEAVLGAESFDNLNG